MLARTRHRENVATMAKARTVVVVMFSLAGSPRQTASRQMATVLNRLSSGVGEPDVHLVMPLGAAKGEPPMGEHSQHLGLITDAKHPMHRSKMSKSKSKLQASDSRPGYCKDQRPRLLGTLLATVTAVPVALAMQVFHGTASSPKAMGRVLVHIVLLAGVSGSGAQLVGPLADSSESATDASAGVPPPPSVDLDAFYSADVDKVAAFLGPEMHFHHGLASAEVNDLLDRSADAGPAATEGSVAKRALEDALRILYPHIPLGSSVLDVGCGWCGPATLLAAERAASVRGLTIARAQAEF